jgi:hypothetical protein
MLNYFGCQQSWHPSWRNQFGTFPLSGKLAPTIVPQFVPLTFAQAKNGDKQFWK